MNASEGEIVDNHRLDYLYTHAFKDGAGKYFTVVSADENGAPIEIEVIHPSQSLRTKIKTTLTFIRTPEGGEIRHIEFKRFQKYVQKGWVEQVDGIRFSFPFFVGLVGFLQGLAGLDLDSVNERRIPLADTPALDAQTKARFRTFMSTDEGQAIIREAIRQGDITKADLVNIGYRKAQLAIFESLLGDPTSMQEYMQTHGLSGGIEGAWQHFFEANTWIFGYGLDFVFNQPLEGKRLEQTVRGFDVAGHGKRVDGLLKSAGFVNSLCLVEIKTPGAPLLEEVSAYRVDCWRASKELGGGIAQAQKTAQKTIENVNISPVMRGSRSDGAPTAEVVYSYQPKSFLIIGRLREFWTEHGVHQEKFSSFDLFRKNIFRPEIITFDELFERAKFITSRAGPA